ncbi:hypothetical protein [Devosia sp.]|uniref:hypothetical protein n=1 Tax=Devosia sp. TaxID=1871048 RepID=UPI001B193BF3|nr:hypothetical protein [Devosia sp.]MBO9589578.1 hypothetical protein [Devosia sp.]
MNLRILKKLSKRAAPLLVTLGDHREHFRAAHARTGDNYHGLIGFPRKNWERSPCHPTYQPTGTGRDRIRVTTRRGRAMVLAEPCHPLKGTAMVGAVSGYYEPEWDEETAWEALTRLVYTHFTDWCAYPDPLPTRRIRSVSDVFAAAADIINEYDILPSAGADRKEAA